MTERLIRLMRIITLVQAKPGILARELAERCETTERTIYRDMDALSAMHIPVVNMGHGRGYQFISRFALYPLNWTEEEDAAFAKVAEKMDQIKPILPSAFESAYEKVMAASLKKNNERVEWAEQFAAVMKLGAGYDNEQDEKVLVSIVQASVFQNTMEVTYSSPAKGTEGHIDGGSGDRLRIDPYYLLPKEHHFYVIGHCHQTNRVEALRMSCIREVDIMTQTFRRETAELQSFFKETWSVHKGNEHTTYRVRFKPHAADRVRRSEMLVQPVLIEEPGGSLLLEITLNDHKEFMDWLVQYGSDAEILEPPQYRNELRERLKTWLALYENEGSIEA
ncbi:WYL domain-containing protein [Paenibacillus urinalis]|uniref:WYL domain-containing protein n=1 Tax=Paenibacillus urinalis TaxID=521520 RepID=A0ABY7XCU7_9BACL|nr:WYL domain-containing protein [Paenibacillus urinalis]WDI03418.1 WYL domain-containing protein [Paenibacillus urinalis]